MGYIYIIPGGDNITSIRHKLGISRDKEKYILSDALFYFFVFNGKRTRSNG